MFRNAKKLTGRSGFTLLELLVVIAIIGILSAMIAAGVFSAKVGSERKTTETTISKVASALDQQIKATIDNANKSTVLPAVTALAGNESRRARAIWVKLNVRKEYPVSFAEATSSFAVTGPTTVASPPVVFNQLGGATSLSPEEQSAVCLYLTLTASRRGVEFDPSSAVGGTGIGSVTDRSNGKVYKVFVDSWGTPIILVRVPQGAVLAEMNDPSIAGNFPNRDPGDREGMLRATPWNPIPPTTNSDKTNLSIYLGQGFTNDNYQSYIASAGPDKRFSTGDDLYSFRLRKAGQRGD